MFAGGLWNRHLQCQRHTTAQMVQMATYSRIRPYDGSSVVALRRHSRRACAGHAGPAGPTVTATGGMVMMQLPHSKGCTRLLLKSCTS
jgi:hypothetical protein